MPGENDAAEWTVELAFNTVDWELYVAADRGEPAELRAGEKETAFRPWRAPKWYQITAGYAIDSGMLSSEEACSVLRNCLREVYPVNWLKRTTPLIAEESGDVLEIQERAVLCNTPQSLAYFCRALRRYGFEEEARILCRRLYGKMIEAGSSTLWEEFAPRSSRCHAWGAMCVEVFLDSGGMREVG
ncbi:hypothetical protein P0Y35_06785 [Kiritimatiellaeota bacterium B1221]|nr:hypothetical protein [Kiritimatiellaeota bacterium B1221]